MYHRGDNKKSKVELLEGLTSGKVALESLLPEKWLIFIEGEDGQMYCYNLQPKAEPELVVDNSIEQYIENRVKPLFPNHRFSKFICGDMKDKVSTPISQ